MCEEACQDLLKSCVLFKGIWSVVMKKNGEAIEGRGSIVKCGETMFEGWLVKIPWVSPCVMVL